MNTNKYMIRKDRKWHIVDYKTNVDGSDLDHKYRNQLEAYTRALIIHCVIVGRRCPHRLPPLPCV